MSDTGIGLQGAGIGLNILGGILSGNSAAATGKAQQEAADYSAMVLRQQAGQVLTTSQAAATNQRISTQYVLSTARAHAAASGGGATDPGVLTVEGNIAARGEYNALSTIYSGQEKANGMNNQADLDQFTGQQEAAAGRSKQIGSYFGAIGAGAAGFGGLAAKYGGGFSGGYTPLAASQNPGAGGAGGFT